MTIVRFNHLAEMALLIAVVGMAGRAKADPVQIGGLSFTNFGLTTANTGNIDTSTTFTMSNWLAILDGNGVFTDMPVQTIGFVSFDSTIPTGLNFGNSVFGNFASASIVRNPSGSGFANFTITGLWTPGTFGNVTGGPLPATLELGFTQVSPTAVITSSASLAVFSTEETEVPEPPSLILGLTGLIAGVVIHRFRRHPRQFNLPNFA
jgi:hypothetical protein